MIPKFEHCKVGVALSGGGAKGIAHLGVLKALEDNDIHIDMLSGVSAGSIVGVLYADGHTPEDICDYLKKSNLFSMTSITHPRNGGISNMNRFKEFIENKLKARTFEELKLPFIVNATDLNEGCNTYFQTGKLIDCIIASSSVPVMFKPVEINGKLYVDGGFFCNMPVNILRKNGCNLVIGVHVNPITYIEKFDGLRNVSERVFHLAVNGNTIEEKKNCDIVIETTKARDYGMFDATAADEIFNIGYEAAIEALENFDYDEYRTKRMISDSYQK